MLVHGLHLDVPNRRHINDLIHFFWFRSFREVDEVIGVETRNRVGNREVIKFFGNRGFAEGLRRGRGNRDMVQMSGHAVQVKSQQGVRPKRSDPSHDSANDYLGCDVLHTDWFRAVDQEVKATLEALSRILNESIEFKDVRIVLDFSYGTSHSRFKHGIIALNAKKICGITGGKGIIKQAEFLLEFAHELGHYVNTMYSAASSNPYVTDLSTFRSHANGVVMEVIADAFSDRVVELLINDERYVETLKGSSDKGAITQCIHDTKLSKDYFQRLRAFTILMLAQKPKREFGSIAERITQLSLDSTYVETFIGNNTTYWLDDGTPPPEMLQLLRYHSGIMQNKTDNMSLSLDDSSWLTGFWTPSGISGVVEVQWYNRSR